MVRDWLSVLKLDWGQIKRISLEPVIKLDLLQTTYSSLFDGSLGTTKGVSAHLKLKENAVFLARASTVRVKREDC